MLRASSLHLFHPGCFHEGVWFVQSRIGTATVGCEGRYMSTLCLPWQACPPLVIVSCWPAAASETAAACDAFNHYSSWLLCDSAEICSQSAEQSQSGGMRLWARIQVFADMPVDILAA